jgi:TPR repeat protein
MKRSLLLAIWFGLGATILAGAEGFNPRLVEAKRLDAKKNGGAAETEYRRAIAFAREKLADQDVSDAIYSLGQHYRMAGRHADAVTELLDSLKIQERLTGPDDVRTGRRLAELAAAYLQNREVMETRAILERLRPIRAKYRGKERKFVDGLYESVAGLDRATGEFKEIAAAAERGDADARYALAGCYEDGLGVAPDPAKALQILESLAADGHLESQCYLGVKNDKARGVPRDATKAAGWFRTAAERGFAQAQYNLAIMLAEGDGVAKNLIEALAWAQKARSGGNPGADRVVSIIEGRLEQERIR